MEALNRKPNLGIRKTMTLPDGTRIDEIGLTVRKQMELANNKSLSETDRGFHLAASKILVDGKPIVYDDLMDGFNTEELDAISTFLFPEKAKEDKDEKNV